MRKSIPIISGSILFMAFVLTACGGSDTGKNKESEKGGVDTSSSQFKIDKLSKLILQSPKNFQYYYDRSKLYYQSGNTMHAIEDIDNCIKNYENWPPAYHLRGFYAYVQDQDSVALHYLKKAAEMGSTDPETFYQIGQIHFFKQDYSEADKWYDTAILLDSLQPLYSFAKGYLQEAKKDFNQAIKFYEESLRKDPGFIKALWRLYVIYKEEKKNTFKAMTYNDRILQVDSLHPIGTFNNGVFDMENGIRLMETSKDEKYVIMLKQAVGAYNKTLQVDPHFKGAAFNRGYCFMMLHKLDEALRDFTIAIEQDPLNDKAFFLMGSIQEGRGEKENALANYQQALLINPKLTQAAEGVRDIKAQLNIK